jgi:hypothetical protein
MPPLVGVSLLVDLALEGAGAGAGAGAGIGAEADTATEAGAGAGVGVSAGVVAGLGAEVDTDASPMVSSLPSSVAALASASDPGTDSDPALGATSGSTRARSAPGWASG